MTAILAAVGVCAGVWLFMRWKAPRPDHPPLRTAPDDPLLLAAMEKAKSTRQQFAALVGMPHEDAVVKLRFVSNSDQVEHLWAELVEVLDGQRFTVRLVTPPVTHTGKLERLRQIGIDDIEDWQVRDAQDKLQGGFTQRAMFAIARRDGVPLSRELLEQEKAYSDGPGA